MAAREMEVGESGHGEYCVPVLRLSPGLRVHGRVETSSLWGQLIHGESSARGNSGESLECVSSLQSGG